MKNQLLLIAALIVGFYGHIFAINLYGIEFERVYHETRNLEIRGKLNQIKSLGDRLDYVEQNHRFSFLKSLVSSTNWSKTCRQNPDNLICRYYIKKIECPKGQEIRWVVINKEKTTRCI